MKTYNILLIIDAQNDFIDGGCCIVRQDLKVDICCEDQFDWKTTCSNLNLLQPIFKDGKLLKETSLSEIRNRLHNKF